MKRNKEEQKEKKVYEKEVSEKEAKILMMEHKGISSDERFNIDPKERSYCVGVTLKNKDTKEEVDCFYYKVEY